MNNIYIYYIKYKDKLKELNEFKYWNVIIITIWTILYILGMLKMGNIKYFVIACLVIWVYKIVCNCIEKQLKKIYINDKYFYILIKISEKTNMLLFLITNFESLLYKISNYNKKTYLIKIVLSLITPLKLAMWYIYLVIKNIKKYTLYELIWKRAYGTILSVLIFTNITQIILEVCGTRLNMLIGWYIIIFILSYKKKSEYKVFKFDYINESKWLSILYVNTYEIWQIKSEANLMCNYIKKNWNKKTSIEKFKFLCAYGYYLNVNWLEIFNIDSYNKWEIQTKLKILNQITKGVDFDFEMEYWFWFENILNNLYYIHLNVNQLLVYFSHLLYLQLLYEKFKGTNNIEIYKEHNVKNLLEYIKLMIKLYLYYLWDIINIIELEIDDTYGLRIVNNNDNLNDLDPYIEWQNKKKNYNLIFKDTYIKIEKQDYKKFYEIKLFANLGSPLGYINDNEKYKKYIEFYNWYNNSIKFKTEENEILILKEDLDVMDMMELSMCSEITEEWYIILEKEKEELIKGYKKGIYIEYLKKV